MGVLTDGFMTVVSLTRELDGRIWDEMPIKRGL